MESLENNLKAVQIARPYENCVPPYLEGMLSLLMVLSYV